ncbi:FG-GAP and VCBS repeat-containing protein [Streptomyces sp. NPDC004134]|uniref:FG-GAP and VCBS repeat-containing protein n=1 Tax=Streptomyces sp. NPDC004134 TaxID=3364691 RepID=UPI003699DD8F
MPRSRRTPTTATALAASLAVVAGAALAGGAAPAAAAPTEGAVAAPAKFHDDFNGDGYPDLVVAAPSGTVDGAARAGYVAVLYGSAGGLDTARRAVVSQSTAGVPGTSEAGDAFGATLASADFDRDGYADLAVGVTGEDLGGVADTGRTIILYGSSGGLSGSGAQDLRPASAIEGNAYGTGLAAGDWFHDGSPALAILSKDHLELYGGWGPARTPSRAEAGHPFGDFPQDFTPTGLVGGDFEGDGADDLVVTGTKWYLEYQQGHSLYLKGGGPEGYTRSEFAGGPVGVAGDIDKDGADDLAIGDPSVLEHGQFELSGGAVEVWYGADGGPGAGQPEVWQQGSGGVPGAYEVEDRFGSDVSLGDVNGDGFPDLAAGAEGEAIGTNAGAGAVWLLRGSAGGLTTTGVQHFNQDTPGIPGAAEAGDLFGSDVRLHDPNRDGRSGLIAGAPGENAGQGFAWVLQARSSGLIADGSWNFSGASVGANGANARFPETIAE